MVTNTQFHNAPFNRIEPWLCKNPYYCMCFLSLSLPFAETEGRSRRSLLPSAGRRVSNLHPELAAFALSSACHYFSHHPVIYFGSGNVIFPLLLPPSDSQVCPSPTAAMSCRPPSRSHSSSARETPSTNSSASSSLTGCSRSALHTNSDKHTHTYTQKTHTGWVCLSQLDQVPKYVKAWIISHICNTHYLNRLLLI